MYRTEEVLISLERTVRITTIGPQFK